jgi:hypothetical protein
MGRDPSIVLCRGGRLRANSRPSYPRPGGERFNFNCKVDLRMSVQCAAQARCRAVRTRSPASQCRNSALCGSAAQVAKCLFYLLLGKFDGFVEVHRGSAPGEVVEGGVT